MGINLFSTSYREAAKWGQTSQIQQKANDTAKSAMTDSFVEKIKTLAQKDAQKGIYMDNEFVQLQHDKMKNYVSPDRSGAMSQATQVLQELKKEDDPLLELINNLLRRLFGKVQHSKGYTLVSLSGMSGNCSAKIMSNSGGQTAEIYSPDGEMIAGYNSLGGGWHIVQTKAETKFLGEAASVYAQAFKEARAEMRVAAQNQVSQSDSSNIDVRA